MSLLKREILVSILFVITGGVTAMATRFTQKSSLFAATFIGGTSASAVAFDDALPTSNN